MLFLSEIRYSKFAYKITTVKKEILESLIPIQISKTYKPKLVIKNETILKWYKESLEPEHILTPEYVNKVNEGISYRIREKQNNKL